MNEPRVRYDFAHFCQVFATWFQTHGWSQARLESAGGPSKPIQMRLMTGEWKSQRPNDVAEKVDRGFGWPVGTAWRVLTTGYDPIADPPSPRVSLTKPPRDPEPAAEHDTLLYRRPDGLSDAEWEKLKDETRDYFEYLIDKAARER